jgi:hypothetical protein
LIWTLTICVLIDTVYGKNVPGFVFVDSVGITIPLSIDLEAIRGGAPARFLCGYIVDYAVHGGEKFAAGDGLGD